ncbi:MAG: hypothetical protein N5P05_004596 [Chroococcopsis gigantea SAG 12.99]|nr:hypothetical protein [Chroococcopsis gigantea SAG 12.99]
MPKTAINPHPIDDRLGMIERELSGIDGNIDIYSSPVSYSEGISREERLIQEKADREALALLKSQKADLEDEKLRLTAKKTGIARDREEAARKKREAARKGLIPTAEVVEERLKAQLKMVDETIDKLMMLDRDCFALGSGYIHPSSAGTLALIKEFINSDEIQNLRTIK